MSYLVIPRGTTRDLVKMMQRKVFFVRKQDQNIFERDALEEQQLPVDIMVLINQSGLKTS